MSDLALRFLLFEGIASILLGTILIGHRFSVQPFDRIRLTQFGFALVAVSLLWVVSGLGPKWAISPTFLTEKPRQHPFVENQVSHEGTGDTKRFTGIASPFW